MSHAFIKFHHVTFHYETATEALFQEITLHIASGWSGVVGPNGTGKTTLLKLATGLLEPLEGHIDRPQRVVYCPQRTDHAPESFDEFLFGYRKTAQILKGQLGIQEDWAERWQTLSHGERKRAQIAVALWLEPDVLAIDEPTNHVDAQARSLLITALHSFSGTGLLVSHDRELLDSLCQHCLFIEPPHVVVLPGGYTKGKQIASEEKHAVQKQHALKKQVYKTLRREAGKRRELANQYQSKRSKRGIAAKDHDAKAKIDKARVTGKDIVGGKLMHQLDGRLAHAQQELNEMKVNKDYTLGIWLPGSTSKRDMVLHIPAGSLLMGEQKHLHYPPLCIRPDDRIAITGPNGAGKSTLLRKLVTLLNVPEEHITYIPQEIDVQQSQEILRQVQALPHERKGHLLTIVSRLGSRPHRLLESTTPSPGETRKLLLGLGMTREPHVIIMDEPTNHMDLPSIECLEQALASCPCCLVLVSHDTRFLQTLTRQRWHLSQDASAQDVFRLELIG